MIIEKKKIADLIPAPYNPRQSTAKQEKHLKESLEKFGLVEPIIFNKQTGYIVGGHFRVRELKKLGIKEIECVIVDLNEDDEMELNIRLNANTGGWDWDTLANDWDVVDLEAWGLDIPQFDTVEELEASEDDYDVPEGGIETDIVIGDLFEIGEHRLLCGDSTDSDAVARLMNGEKADMVFTDPPYGINHSGKGIDGDSKGNDFGEILGDKDVSIAIDSFNLCTSLFPKATLIFWGANYYPQCLPNGYGWLFWDKEKEGNTFSGGELAFVNIGIRFDVFRHQWHGMIKASEMGEKRIHPTQKPIALASFCFDNYKAGNLIVDFFLGSGSTMVAAHQLKRKCYGMELEPKYCQVIIERMRKLDSTLIIKRNGVELKTTK
jgi:DNA modification methylase